LLALLATLLLPGTGCLQLNFSDGWGGIYGKGNGVYSTPLPGVPVKAGPLLPASVSKYPGMVLYVDRATHRLNVYVNGRFHRKYPVAFGLRSEGHKLHEGDRKTPEGIYRVKMKKNLGQTRFHRALLLDYPNARDRRIYRKAIEKRLVPRGRGIGGLIEVHGGGTGVDWTDGCIALENEHMDELVSRVVVGTPVVIVADARKPEVVSLPEGLALP
jgi:hypothetical protein